MGSRHSGSSQVVSHSRPVASVTGLFFLSAIADVSPTKFFTEEIMKVEREYFSYSQIAKKLGIGTTRITKWVESGKLTAINLNQDEKQKSPRYRVKMSDVEALLATKAVQPTRKRRTKRKKKLAYEFI